MLPTRKALSTKGLAIPAERIEGAILFIRGEKVMLDVALAALYGVPTKALNQAVRRNIGSCENPFSHVTFAGIFPEFVGGWESSMHRVEMGISTQRCPWREGDDRCGVGFPVSSADRDA